MNEPKFSDRRVKIVVACRPPDGNHKLRTVPIDTQVNVIDVETGEIIRGLVANRVEFVSDIHGRDHGLKVTFIGGFEIDDFEIHRTVPASVCRDEPCPDGEKGSQTCPGCASALGHEGAQGVPGVQA